MTTKTRNWIDEARERLTAIAEEQERSRKEHRLIEEMKSADNVLRLVGKLTGEEPAAFGPVDYLEYPYGDLAGITFAILDVEGVRVGACWGTDNLMVFRECPACGRQATDEVEYRMGQVGEDRETEARLRMQVDFVQVLNRQPGSGSHACGRIIGDRNFARHVATAVKLPTASEQLIAALERFVVEHTASD